MPFAWFSLGVLVGVGVWLWRRTQDQLRLKSLFRNLGVKSWRAALDSTRHIEETLEQYQANLETANRQRDNYYQALQAAPWGYLQVNDENQLLWCNHQASRLLGIPLMTEFGQQTRPRLLLEWVRSYELDVLIENTRKTQKLCQQDWIFYRVSPDPLHPKNEPAYPFRAYGLPLADQQVGVFLESRQEAETLLQQRNRWTSDVAHELKTPLTSIRLVAETLKPRVSEALQGWIDRLLNETIRLSNLVEDLLNLSRLEGQSFQGLNLKPVNLEQLIAAAWLSLEPLARIKQLQLQYDGPQDLVMNLDEPLMHRVLINLFDNAIKHSPPGATVFAKVGFYGADLADSSTTLPPEDLQVLLEVIDMGAGFQARDLPHIFDRFYRADLSRKRDPNRPASSEESRQGLLGQPGSGAGLGLSIVHQIVEAHQGTIKAANHKDLGGGWLKIQLPGSLILESENKTIR